MELSRNVAPTMLRGHDDHVAESKRLTTIAETQDDRLQHEAPRHPIRSLQGALEEALMDDVHRHKARWAPVPSKRLDPATRRQKLLQPAGADAEPYVSRWRRKPGERFHPLAKLVAQITFAIHLLHKGLVASDDEVVRVLQAYVADMDAFLEQTTEDFDLALGDIDERIKCLRLPLEHDEIFDAMLEDRAFRSQIVDGNEKIEHIIERTGAAMNSALEDVQEALEATKELAKYLVRLERKWQRRTNQQEDIYAAMSGNSEGWFRCFFGLQTKGHSLSVLMIQLGSVVGELQRRAGIASRKNLVSHDLFFVERRLVSCRWRVTEPLHADIPNRRIARRRRAASCHTLTFQVFFGILVSPEASCCIPTPLGPRRQTAAFKLTGSRLPQRGIPVSDQGLARDAGAGHAHSRIISAPEEHRGASAHAEACSTDPISRAIRIRAGVPRRKRLVLSRILARTGEPRPAGIAERSTRASR